MKIRQGFVSNSSSSSFVILQKNLTLSVEEILKRNLEILLKDCGDEEYANEQAKDYADERKLIILTDRVPYSDDPESAERMIKKFAKAFNINTEDLIFEIGD